MSIFNFFNRYRVRIYKIFNHFAPFKNYSISYYFSRFGNNLQQISVGILFSETVKGNFYIKNHKYVEDFTIINNNFSNKFKIFKKHYRFFYFKEKQDFPNKILTEQFVIDNLQNIFQKKLYNNIGFLKEFPVDEDTLILHIRSGDIFTKPIKTYYQNPINYYTQIIKEYKKVILVTSHEKNNPIFKVLSKMKKITVQSASLEEDFNLLVNAKNLATSGVGTFPIAAALLSQNLKNIYYTNLYSNQHLNPTMIKKDNVIHHKFDIDPQYIDNYLTERNLESLILDKSIQVYKKLI